MDKLSETSPARVLLAKEPTIEANFKHHPNAITRDAKLVRYQQNPLPNWGPAARASAGTRTKRKRPQGDE
jgi:tRNA (guanine26-N2/guanine27-N2)-dimethyltransferase